MLAALASAVPPPRKQYPRRPRPAMEPNAVTVDGLLLAASDRVRFLATDQHLPVRDEGDAHSSQHLRRLLSRAALVAAPWSTPALARQRTAR